MTNTDTADVESTAVQVAALARAGSQLVRITVNNEDAAAAVPEIARRVEDLGVTVPLIGDFHYNGHLLLTAFPDCARTLAKYRINPGNVGSKRRDENFSIIARIAAQNGKPVRIGVNWGSLDQDLLTQMMDANSQLPEPREARDVYMEAMLESALRSALLAEGVVDVACEQWNARRRTFENRYERGTVGLARCREPKHLPPTHKPGWKPGSG